MTPKGTFLPLKMSLLLSLASLFNDVSFMILISSYRRKKIYYFFQDCFKLHLENVFFCTFTQTQVTELRV